MVTLAKGLAVAGESGLEIANGKYLGRGRHGLFDQHLLISSQSSRFVCCQDHDFARPVVNHAREDLIRFLEKARSFRSLLRVST